MKYGDLPIDIGSSELICPEMMFYQYLPIKWENSFIIRLESRLSFLEKFIEKVCIDFVESFGESAFVNSYIYLTIKHQYQMPNTSFNRMGYHSDGFMTEDINYIWSNTCPTVFNKGEFNLTMDDEKSMEEMNAQAHPENEITFPNNHILRLNQFNIHKVNENCKAGMRTFIKVSFSQDKYDLMGNSHNYEIDYNWEMKERSEKRNIPQSSIK